MVEIVGRKDRFQLFIILLLMDIFKPKLILIIHFLICNDVFKYAHTFLISGICFQLFIFLLFIEYMYTTVNAVSLRAHCQYCVCSGELPYQDALFSHHSLTAPIPITSPNAPLQFKQCGIF